MPSWEIHNKWANNMGLSLSDKELNGVNLLIDVPQKHKAYQDYCSENPNCQMRGKTGMNIGQFTKHDGARSKPIIRKAQEEFLTTFDNEEYEKAFYLHQILDYLMFWISPNSIQAGYTVDEALYEKHIAQKIGAPDNPIVKVVVTYVKANLTDIVDDCKAWSTKYKISKFNHKKCIDTKEL
jgi:hypothetical protein